MNPISKGLAGAQWLLTKSGIGASNHFETAGFVTLDPNENISGCAVSFPSRSNTV